MLLLEKRDVPDMDFEEHYNITFCYLDSLGYLGSGDKIRGFDFNKFFNEIRLEILNTKVGAVREGYHWKAYDIDAVVVGNSVNARLDYKYWDVNVQERIGTLMGNGNSTIQELNLITTCRGKSPTSDSYVDATDGYAIVIKAGSNMSKFGTLITDNSDWIEKSVYDEFVEKSKELEGNLNLVYKGDVLLASTGDGTLGKCCVYDIDYPAIADGHVTIIRIDSEIIDPYYLADYLRKGFGAVQINRLYTGATGLIELTPDQVDTIVVDMQSGVKEQREISERIRKLEREYIEKVAEADELLSKSRNVL